MVENHKVSTLVFIRFFCLSLTNPDLIGYISIVNRLRAQSFIAVKNRGFDCNDSLYFNNVTKACNTLIH